MSEVAAVGRRLCVIASKARNSGVVFEAVRFVVPVLYEISELGHFMHEILEPDDFFFSTFGHIL